MKKWLSYFFLFLLIFSFVFRTLILHLSDNLLDWNDYPVFVWIIFQNIEKILNFQFSTFFNTNAFYPHPNTLLFSETFLTQSLIGIPFTLVLHNPVLIFNLIFIITFCLNYFSTFIFWKLIFKRDYLAFLGSIFTIFSPFFHLEHGHFQMLSYWPFFFCLYFLFKIELENKKNAFFTGLFLAIQFLASIYLSFFLIFAILIFFIIEAVSKKKFSQVIESSFLIFLVFFLISGIFIKGYFDTKRIYKIHRNPNEYIQYSAEVSDYLFTSPINSLIHKTKIIQNWNSLNKNYSIEKSSFPGFLLLVLSLFGLVYFFRKKTISKSRVEFIFFITLTFFGIYFSLGPRLVFNGKYIGIPLVPYYFMVKFLPVFDSIRVPTRWSFLFYFGLIYFSLTFLANLKARQNFLLIAIFVFFILEYLPFDIQTHKENYINNQYSIIKNICSQKKQVLLEIPVTHLSADNSTQEGLNYISKVELASLYHQCYIINGYSGYDLPSLFEFPKELDSIALEENVDKFYKILKDKQINLLKINFNMLPKGSKDAYKLLTENIEKDQRFQKLGSYLYLVKY